MENKAIKSYKTECLVRIEERMHERLESIHNIVDVVAAPAMKIFTQKYNFLQPKSHFLAIYVQLPYKMDKCHLLQMSL